jgi:tetratricopeptide (TPR) repeat protein
VGRFWEAIATYESTRHLDRARYAAEIAAERHGATGENASRYYALMLLAVNWRADARSANSVFETARTLEDPAWPPRLLALGRMTEGALLTGAGRFAEARTAYQRAVRYALTTSDRQALEATVNIVELDLTCGDTGAALQLGRPLALSLEHQGRRETRFELLSTLFSALLMAGEIDEARATGRQIHDLAARFDASKLYSALDAMAYLACEDRLYEAAARIVACADAAHEAHGHAARRPIEERLRTATTTVLCEQIGPAWRDGIGGREPLDEITACAVALGMCP